MDVLDLVVVCILVLGAWNGYRLGLIRQLIRLFGVVISYFVALWLRPYAAPIVASLHIVPQPTGLLHLLLGDVNNAIAFAVVFVLAFIVLRYGAGLVDTLFRLPLLSTLNRLSGLVAGLALAVASVYVASLLAQYIPNATLQHQLQQSMAVHWLKGTSTQAVFSKVIDTHRTFTASIAPASQ